MAKKITSDEMRIDGTNEDAALHDEILDNPAADKALAKEAIKRAMKWPRSHCSMHPTQSAWRRR